MLEDGADMIDPAFKTPSRGRFDGVDRALYTGAWSLERASPEVQSYPSRVESLWLRFMKSIRVSLKAAKRGLRQLAYKSASAFFEARRRCLLTA